MFFFLSFTSIFISISRVYPPSNETLVIWDAQTGVVIKEPGIWNLSHQHIDIRGCSPITFSDQRTMTLHCGQYFYTYDGFNGTQLSKTELPPPECHQLGAQWAYKGSLRFAMRVKTDGKHVINIQELQQTSNPLYSMVNSFPVSPYDGEFSFSPVSSHASFVTEMEVVILNVQDSKILLYTKVAQPLYNPPGCFSPNGCFFACGTLGDEICVWKNTPTGYMAWSTLQPRLPFQCFSFSSTTDSILTWDQDRIQLLYPDNYVSPPSFNKTKSLHQHKGYLVAFSVDRAHIAVAQQEDAVVMIFDPLLGILQQSIDTGMEIQDIKIANGAVFVVDKHKLIRWDLKAEGIMHGVQSARSVTVDGTLAHRANPDTVKLSALSHDCSQIAFTTRNSVFLYNINSQETSKCKTTNQFQRIQFSPDGHQLQLGAWVYGIGRDYLMQLEIVGNHFTNTATQDLKHKWVQVNPQSAYGYYVGVESEWVKDSEGKKLLWLPPSWRVKDSDEVRWEDNLLVLADSRHSEPITIGFQL